MRKPAGSKMAATIACAAMVMAEATVLGAAPATQIDGCQPRPPAEGASAAAGCALPVPLPTPRPDPVTTGSTARPRRRKRSDYTYLRMRGPDGRMRTVRLVGQRFLQNRKDQIDFRAIARKNTNPLDALLNKIVELLGVPQLIVGGARVAGDHPTTADAKPAGRPQSRSSASPMAASEGTSDRHATPPSG